LAEQGQIEFIEFGKLFSAGKVLQQELIVGCLCQDIQLE
jgi:hypothetical protein